MYAQSIFFDKMLFTVVVCGDHGFKGLLKCEARNEELGKMSSHSRLQWTDVFTDKERRIPNSFSKQARKTRTRQGAAVMDWASF